MIRPAKHLNLNICVVRLASIILRHLRRNQVETCAKLLKKINDVAGDDAQVWFIPAVDLLYILGRIDYHAKTDAFEYLAAERENNK